MVSSNSLGPAFDSVVERARRGESGAFERLYRAYAGRVKAFAVTRQAVDPDAVANDTMLRVFQNLEAFRGDEPAMLRWIFTIARNRMIDLHRAAQRRPESVTSEIPEQPIESAESQAMQRLSEAVMVDRLGELTEEQREVIALRLIADLSLADVSAIVDRPVTAVKALQRRGLRQLEKKILDEGVS